MLEAFRNAVMNLKSIKQFTVILAFMDYTVLYLLRKTHMKLALILISAIREAAFDKQKCKKSTNPISYLETK